VGRRLLATAVREKGERGVVILDVVICSFESDLFMGMYSIMKRRDAENNEETNG